MYETDIIDSKIVDLLMEDGRMPSAVIARRLGDGLSERIVRYRIAKMEKMGIIKIRPIVNADAFGLSTRADVFLEVESDSIKNVALTVSKLECVTYVACSIGATDISLQVVGRNTDDVYQLVTDVIGRIPGVRKTIISIVPMVVKDVYEWGMPKKLVVHEFIKENL